VHEPIAPQYPFEWLGCFSFRSALASTAGCARAVTENYWPTSSRVCSLFIPMPKRMRRMSSSRGVNGAGTRVAVSRRFDWMAASMGKIAFLSSMKSPVGTPVADLLIEGGVPVIFYSGSALPVASRERHPSASRLVVPVMRRGMVRGLKSVIRQLHGE
jgi:hypothetical protein